MMTEAEVLDFPFRAVRTAPAPRWVVLQHLRQNGWRGRIRDLRRISVVRDDPLASSVVVCACLSRASLSRVSSGPPNPVPTQFLELECRSCVVEGWLRVRFFVGQCPRCGTVFWG